MVTAGNVIIIEQFRCQLSGWQRVKFPRAAAASSGPGGKPGIVSTGPPPGRLQQRLSIGLGRGDRSLVVTQEDI